MPKTKTNALRIMLFNLGAMMSFLIGMIMQSAASYQAGHGTSSIKSIVIALVFAILIFGTGLFASAMSFNKGLLFGGLVGLLPLVIIIAGKFLLGLNIIFALILPIILIVLSIVLLNNQAEVEFDEGDDYDGYEYDEYDEYDDDEDE